MSNIRTFIAVEVSNKTRERAGLLIDLLRASDANVKWVDAANIHLTLNFLGDVDERQIPEVCAAIHVAAQSVDPFELVCAGVGAFPNAQRPRTLWIGTDEGTDEVCALQSSTETELDEIGFPKEKRKFKPHLTIGRIRRGGGSVRRLNEMLKETSEFDAGKTIVSEVVVFSSELQPSGPVYHALARCPLG